ncbi:MAG TPA: hypothetical protein DD789_02120, partial [Firmicutes bacterium]|nr:hypothetical protein [Bacillota bacterium]
MIQSERMQINALKQEINGARQRLQTLWNTRGCSDYAVLRASIEVDLLINEYQGL